MFGFVSIVETLQLHWCRFHSTKIGNKKELPCSRCLSLNSTKWQIVSVTYDRAHDIRSPRSLEFRPITGTTLYLWFGRKGSPKKRVRRVNGTSDRFRWNGVTAYTSHLAEAGKQLFSCSKSYSQLPATRTPSLILAIRRRSLKTFRSLGCRAEWPINKQVFN